MEAKRTASPATPPPPWAVRRSDEAAVRRTAVTAASATTLCTELDRKLVSSDEGRADCEQAQRRSPPPRRPARERRHDERQQTVFDLEHAGCERLRRIVGADGHRPLGDDRPVVVLLVHVVHRGAGHPHPAREHLLVHAAAVHAGAAERREQRRVDINHAQAKAGDGGGRHAPQVPREHDYASVAECGHDLVRVSRIGEDRGGDTRTAGPLERACVGPARDHARDARDGRASQLVQQRLEVRASARHEDGDADGRGGGGGGAQRSRRQRTSDLGWGPLATVSVKGPARRFSVLVTAMKYAPVEGKRSVIRALQLPPESSSCRSPASPGPYTIKYASRLSEARSMVTT